MKYIYLYSLLVIAAGIAGCTPKTGSHSPSLITEINWEEMTEEGKPLPQPLPLVCDIAEMTTYDSMILLKSDKTAPAFNILPTDLKKSTAKNKHRANRTLNYIPFEQGREQIVFFFFIQFHTLPPKQF